MTYKSRIIRFRHRGQDNACPHPHMFTLGSYQENILDDYLIMRFVRKEIENQCGADHLNDIDWENYEVIESRVEERN